MVTDGCFRVSLWGRIVATATVVAVVAPGQAMSNAASAALAINGTGRFDVSVGSVLPTNSQTSPIAALLAPIFRHRSAPGASLQFAVQGNPNRPIILAYGGVAAVPIQLGASGKVELDLATAQVIVDGVNPTGFLSLSANTGPFGEWSVTVPGGVPASFAGTQFQAAVFDPTLPGGFRMTGTIGLTAVNTVDVLNRNVVDAYFQSIRHPSYMASITSSDFRHDGENLAQFGARNALRMMGDPVEGYPTSIEHHGIGPNTTTGPSVPTTAPTSGQSVAMFAEWTEKRASALGATPCGAANTWTTRSRTYDLNVKEQNGVWRFAGNQRDVEIHVGLEVANALVPTPQNGGLDVSLVVSVEDRLANRGGIAGVTCTGRQLQGVAYSGASSWGTATSTVSGTQPLAPIGVAGLHGSAWELRVLFANALGTSNLPLNENATGPRDVYVITVNWNDGSTSGPYAVPLRAAVDVSASPPLGAAALPYVNGVGSSQLGTWSAATTVNFQPGTFTSGAPLGGLTFLLDHVGLGSGFAFVGVVPPTGTPLSKTFCTPNFVSGPLQVRIVRTDIFGTSFLSDVASLIL